jgi:hypothetical protein
MDESLRWQEEGDHLSHSAANSQIERRRPTLRGRGAFGLTRFLASFLYGLKPTDALTFAASGILLWLVAMAASWNPARRASAFNPFKPCDTSKVDWHQCTYRDTLAGHSGRLRELRANHKLEFDTRPIIGS